MAKLPQSDPIYNALENKLEIDMPRDYLGMSQLGHPCKRYLFYYFRWCFTRTITQRQKRIFARGDLEEPRVIADFEKIGMKVSDDQYELIGFAGHCKGHIDGVVERVPGAEKTPHLLEIKTAKASSFTKFKKEGVKKANENYWAQAQIYMYKMGLTRTLFSVTNKDTEERYFERIHLDKEAAEMYDMVAMEIIGSEELPIKIGGAEWFQCKMCDAKEICHFGDEIRKGCRNCAHVILRPEGKWVCGNKESNLHDKELGKYEQKFVRNQHDCYSPLIPAESS